MELCCGALREGHFLLEKPCHGCIFIFIFPSLILFSLLCYKPIVHLSSLFGLGWPCDILYGPKIINFLSSKGFLMNKEILLSHYVRVHPNGSAHHLDRKILQEICLSSNFKKNYKLFLKQRPTQWLVSVANFQSHLKRVFYSCHLIPTHITKRYFIIIYNKLDVLQNIPCLILIPKVRQKKIPSNNKRIQYVIF